MVDHYNKYGFLFQFNPRFSKTLRFLHQIINNNNNNKHRKLGYLFIDFWCRLVKLAARAFYDDLTSKGENQPKSGRSDNRGIAVVILDALTRFALTSIILDFDCRITYSKGMINEWK